MQVKPAATIHVLAKSTAFDYGSGGCDDLGRPNDELSMVDIITIDRYADIFGQIAVGVGAVSGAIAFMFAKHRERIDRDAGTYATLDDKYGAFLRIATENPDLPLVVDDKFNALDLTDEQMYRLRCCYLILISLMERAYKLYTGVSRKNRANEWFGWEEYIKEYLQFEPFTQEWEILSPQFQLSFVRHVNIMRAQIGSGNKC